MGWAGVPWRQWQKNCTAMHQRMLHAQLRASSKVRPRGAAAVVAASGGVQSSQLLQSRSRTRFLAVPPRRSQFLPPLATELPTQRPPRRTSSTALPSRLSWTLLRRKVAALRRPKLQEVQVQKVDMVPSSSLARKCTGSEEVRTAEVVQWLWAFSKAVRKNAVVPRIV
jgi:hypothetical protein